MNLWPKDLITAEGLMRERKKQIRVNEMNGKCINALDEFEHMIALFKKLEL